MARSVYVASAEGYTGKSTVALGLLEQLSRRVERVGVFRPIVRADVSEHGGRDYVLDLLTSHEACTPSYDEWPASPTTRCTPTRPPLSTGSSSATTRWPSSATPWSSSAATTPTWRRRRSSRSTPGSRPTSARRCCSWSTATAGPRRPADMTVDGRPASSRPTTARCSRWSRTASTEATLVEDAEAVSVPGVPAYAIPEEPMLNAPSVAELMAACDGTLVSGDELAAGPGGRPASWSPP